MRISKTGLVAVGIVVAIVFLVVGALTVRIESADEIGGNWVVVTARPAVPVAEGASPRTLYRRTGGGRTCVARWVVQVRYYGDDCVAYETSGNPDDRRHFSACGDREPFLVATPRAAEWWVLTGAGIEHRFKSEAGPGPAAVSVISVDTLKSEAIARPPRTSGGCD